MEPLQVLERALRSPCSLFSRLNNSNSHLPKPHTYYLIAGLRFSDSSIPIFNSRNCPREPVQPCVQLLESPWGAEGSWQGGLCSLPGLRVLQRCGVSAGAWGPCQAWDFRVWGTLGLPRALRAGFGGVCLAGVLLQAWTGGQQGLCPGGGGCALLEGGDIRIWLIPGCLVPGDAHTSLYSDSECICDL